jgi:TonB family protein
MSARSTIFVLLLFTAASIRSQEGTTEQFLEPVGGKAEFNQVIETQLTLPEILLTKNFAQEAKVNFTIDSLGKATELVFTNVENNVLRAELARILKFFRFEANELPNGIAQPYYVMFSLSTSKYRKYLKQRTKTKIRPPERSDSSMAVVTKADRSPAYYKDEEAGLAEYILNEITYPGVAREQSVQGTVVLQFIIETNGFVTGITPKKTVGAGCTGEAIRLMSETRWQPALLGGKAVRYQTTYPITFSLRSLREAGLQPAGTLGN